MLLLISPKSAYATGRILEECKNLGLECLHFSASHVEEMRALRVGKGDVLFVRSCYPYYDQVVALAQDFSKRGVRVVDENIATQGIEMNKLLYLKELQKHGLISYSFDEKTFPMVMKWVYGRAQKGVRFLKNVEDLAKYKQELPQEQTFFMKYVHADFEYKVIVVGYKALSKVVRVPFRKYGFGADLSNGMPVDSSTVTQVVHLAEEAVRVLGREVAKVDILERDGKLTLLEVNRFPGFEYFERISGYNVSSDVVTYLINTIQKL